MRPDDWQVRLVEMVVGMRRPSSDWFSDYTGRAQNDPIEMLQREYRRKFGGSLRSLFPRFADHAGEGVDECVSGYLRDHPPSSWSMRYEWSALPDWVEQTGDVLGADIARLELAMTESQHAADEPQPDASRLDGDSTLRLQPHVRVLALRYAVHETRVDPPAQRSFYAVYRRGTVRCRKLTDSEYDLLVAFRDAATIESVVSSLVALEPAPGVDTIGCALRWMATEGLWSDVSAPVAGGGD